MSNPDYSLWRSELKTPTAEDRRADRPTDPFKMVGFWMIDGARTKPAWPVSIWANDDKESAFFQIGMNLQNTVADADKFAEFVGSSWLKCLAVTEADWHAAMETGRWPGGRPARHLTDDEKLDLIADTPQAEGGNNPAGEDLFHEQVVTKLTAAIDKAKALPFPIKTMEDAQKGAEIIETLSGLGKQGEAKRKEQKQVWLDGAAAVDAKWSIVRDASEMVAKLKSLIESFKVAERQRLQREADEAARVERERLRLEAEQRAREQAERDAADALARGEAFEDPSPEAIAEQAEAEAEQAMAAAPAPEINVRVGTPHGRAISTPKTKTATITDLRALCEHFIHAADADFIEYLGKRANAAARAKITLPGTRIDQ